VSDWEPDWYKWRDWKISDKCISQDNLREKKICEKEGGQSFVRAKKDFKDGMTNCLQGEDFDQVKKQCSSPDILAKMNKCKSDVYYALMGRKSKEKFMEEYRKCKAKLPPKKK
jgi:hypothetical protein